MLAKEPEALSAVGRIFIEQIFRWQRSIGIRIGLSTTSAAKEKLRGGAICFPQRFGGSLNLNVHFHVIGRRRCNPITTMRLTTATPTRLKTPTFATRSRQTRQCKPHQDRPNR